MYATITKADAPHAVSNIKPVQFTVDPFGVVDGCGNIDNGLGFGQGSVAGLIQPKASCTNFQRPRIPPADCETRKIFNLHRLCTSAYVTHYDPLPCSRRFL